MTLEARAREIVEKWRNIVGTDAVPERDYYETKDYEMLIEWFVAALTEQDEELALEAAHFKELYAQHQILRAQRDALERAAKSAEQVLLRRGEREAASWLHHALAAGTEEK